MKILLIILMALVLSGCTTFKYEKVGANESLTGTTWFKNFRDIAAKRGEDFSLEIGESTSAPPDVSGDMVCMMKLQAGQTCE